MPIKLPKGFARRKSAGNLVEAYEEQPTESSFRVLDRVEVEDYGSSRESRMRKKTTGRPTSSPLQHGSNHSFDEHQYLSNRTNNSNSTGGASSSARHSYQSTEPSSLESASHDDLQFKAQPSYYPPPASFEPSFFADGQGDEQSKFSALGKKRFSIPRPKFGGSSNAAARRGSEATETGRGRSQTVTSHTSSYASTTLPPRLDFGLGSEAERNTGANGAWLDGFANNGRTPIMEEPTSFEPPEPPRHIYRSESDTLLNAKKQFSFDKDDDRPLPISSRFERAPVPIRPNSRSPERNISENGFHSTGTYGSFTENHNVGPGESSPSPPDPGTQLLMDAAFASQALERQLGYTTSRKAAPDRSRVVNNGPRVPVAGERMEQPKTFGSRGSQVYSYSTATTPRAANDESDSLFENSPASTVIRNTNETSSAVQKGTKVMTPAEFEQAKQNAEAIKDDDDDASEASEDSDLYEDEDEAEQTRQMAKQRRKQEAHLAVYRQQMMKVTGEQITDLPERPKMSRFSRSLPNLQPNSASATGKPGLEGEPHGGSGDDSDDEIPLGVLQAHGFPTKSRPPTRMTDRPGLTSRSSTQLSSYPAPPGSTRNDPSAGGGGSGTLPPFARNLPTDPYVGASLVNHSNRESLPYNNPSTPPGARSGSMPPGGLVGVIAGEEHARAMRRGSPNTNGVYGPVPPQQPMNNMLHQQNLSPSEQAQMEMTNSMTQMMQMQMQWMQQMMQMQAMSQQTGTPMPPMPQMPQMPFMAQQFSQQQQLMQQQMMQQQAQAGAQQGNMSTFTPGHQRAASSMSNYMGAAPAPSTFGGMNSMPMEGYAPSIAPSERSNVGQPSRYRPVTPSVPNSARTSTLSQATAPGAPQSDYGMLNNPRARSPGKTQSQPFLAGQYSGYHSANASTGALDAASTIRAVSRPKKGMGGSSAGPSDDEDDAGWEEMKRKREQRKSRWRPRRATANESQHHEQPSGGLEGLYYNGPSED